MACTSVIRILVLWNRSLKASHVAIYYVLLGINPRSKAENAKTPMMATQPDIFIYVSYMNRL